MTNPPTQLPQGSLTIAVIGDVHDQWNADDERVLKALGADLVLLVGDFGNEAVEIVRSIAALSLPKAAIFGNHDAWYSASKWGAERCPYDRQKENRVQQQLDLLGAAHVGYGKLDFPEFGLTVVGARPFSWGGSDWKNAGFYAAYYGVRNFQESVDRIVASIKEASYDHIIFLGHCGPKGLGDQPEDICGKDWGQLGGDHGDPDFTDAISQARLLGKSLSLVAFGHMHHHLRHRKDRLRHSLVRDASGLIYLNAARVPRIISSGAGWLRNVSLVTLESYQVTQALLVWVNQDLQIVDQEMLYSF